MACMGALLVPSRVLASKPVGAQSLSQAQLNGRNPAGHCERAARAARMRSCRHRVIEPGTRAKLAAAATKPGHPLFLVDRHRGIPASFPLGKDERWRSCKDPKPADLADLVCLPPPYTNRWTALRRLAWEGSTVRSAGTHGRRQAGPRMRKTHDGLPVGDLGFRALLDAALKEAGAELLVTSAYRPFAIQRDIFEDHVRREMAKGHSRSVAVVASATYSAQPGHSEHQLGTTADLTYRRPDGELSGFGGFMAHDMHRAWPMQWLRANAHRFGIVQTYRHDRVESSQYVWEPWHWRFVGVQAADAMHACDLGLSEFMSLLHRLPEPPPFAHMDEVAAVAGAIAADVAGEPLVAGRPIAVRPGRTITLGWWVTNLGAKQWDGVHVAPLWFDRGLARPPQAPWEESVSECVPVWSATFLQRSFRAPKTPGGYQGHWMVSTLSGEPIGVFAIDLVVIAGSEPPSAGPPRAP